MKGIRIAAYIAEIIVAGSTIVELVEKYSGRSKRKSAASKVDTGIQLMIKRLQFQLQERPQTG